MGVCSSINTGVSYVCDDKPVSGIEQKLYLFNIDEVDRVSTVVNRDASTNTHNISEFNLVAGAKLYAFEGVENLQQLYASFSTEAGDYGNDSIHMVNALVYSKCEESMSLLNKFLNGAKVGAIVEYIGKGEDSKCAYMIYGFERGMAADEIVYNSNENKGIIPLVLQSKAPALERYYPYPYLEVDYASTTTKIDSLI